MPIPVSYARMSPIHALPVELLTRIFQLGVDSDPLPEEQIDGQPTFEVLVSHVCRHWRQVAIHTPHLWTTLHFRTRVHMDRGHVYLSRNAHLPFDIYVETCSEDDLKERKDLLFRDQFIPVFNVVLPHIARWRELHLIVADLECKSSARKVLSTCGEAPILRTLQLWHVMNWRTPQRLFNHIGPPPVVVFGGSLPSLKHIILQGVNLPWSRSPFLRNLTTVEFALHSDNVRMPFDLWRAMLDSSPNLTRLSLILSGPRAAPSGTGAQDGIEWWGAEPPPPDAVLPPGTRLPPSTDPIMLPRLRELHLQELECDYLLSLVRTFHAPNVRSLELSLDVEDEEYTPFVTFLAAPPPLPAAKLLNGDAHPSAGASAAKFPALERLAVSVLHCTVGSWRALLEASPGITRLEADFTKLCDGAFDVLLERVDAPADEGEQGKGKGRATEQNAPAHKDKVPILPALESVRCSGASGAQLQQLAAFRRAAGRRVRRWELDEGGRDEDAEALEREAAEVSAERDRHREGEGALQEPWRWDEPLERVVWWIPEDGGDDDDDDDDEGEDYADEDGEEGDGDEEGEG